MSRNSKMTITLNADNTDATVSIVHPNGRVTEKCISVEDLMAALAQRHTLSTGILPSNTRFFKGDPNNYTIVIEAPAKVRRFLLQSNTQRYEQGEDYQPRELMVPFPNCLFCFYVNRRRIQNTIVLSMPTRLGSETDTLNRFPFGNTYDDGRVCWGQVRLPDITTPMSLVGVVASFFDAPFNGDLTDSDPFRVPSGVNVSNFWELVNHLEGATSFPQNMLRSAGITFRQMIRNTGGHY